MADNQLGKSIAYLITLPTVTAYLIVSFLTNAWHLTLLIFPLMSAVKRLIFAVMHTKEASL